MRTLFSTFIRSRTEKGFTLVEAMVAGVVLTTVSLSLVGILGNFGKVVTTSREITLATHLAQEKVESLRALSFYQIMVTSAATLDNNFSPPLQYDSYYYPPETVKLGNMTFTRKVYVEKVDTPSGVVENMGYPHPDTGLKRINTYVVWQRKDGEWKKITVSNLSSNPTREALDNRIYGTVTNSVTGLPVAGALVQARRNPGWGSTTDNTGYYSFQATDNSMILISNRYSYAEYTSASFATNYGDNLKNFQMTPIPSATVTGYVITYAGPVISQINNKWHATNDTEFIEVFNQSTGPVSFTGYTLTYIDKWGTNNLIPMVFISTNAPANGYFLFLGSQFGTATSAPDGKAADAYFTSIMNHAQQGAVLLKNSSGGTVDKVAWGNSVNSPTAGTAEGTWFDTGASAGIDQGKTLVRKAISSSTASDMTPAAGAHVNLGNAWDMQDNSSDFVLISTASPRNSSITKNPIGGKGLGGAIVSGSDSISGSTSATSTGYFSIVMATSTWNISAASTTVEGIKSITVPTAGLSIVIILATAPATTGYISGTVRQYGTTPFPSILVRADPGGYQTFSNNLGVYWLALPAGEEYFVTGNPGFYDSNWNTATTPDAIAVEAGVIKDPYDLNIWKNAYVSGRVTTNGIDGLPGVAVVAQGEFSNGNTAMTDGAGYFTISGLRLVGNPYTIYPALVEGQTSSPASYTNVNLTQGNNLTGQNFQITGAYVTITGTATYNGAPIASGVTVMASSGTLSSTSPPDITFAVRNGTSKYYQALTNNGGVYSLTVLGGATYNMVAWYTANSTTTAKTLTTTVTANAGNASSHFTWP